jgi:hypothetical protein
VNIIHYSDENHGLCDEVLKIPTENSDFSKHSFNAFSLKLRNKFAFKQSTLSVYDFSEPVNNPRIKYSLPALSLERRHIDRYLQNLLRLLNHVYCMSVLTAL